MSHITVPQPPQSSLPPLRVSTATGTSATGTSATGTGPRGRGSFQALDYAFLQRCLVVTPAVGAVFSLVLFAWLRSFYVATSYFLGALFGTALLATLTTIVRRMSAAKLGTPYRGWDARIPLWMLAVLKYVAFIVVAWGVAVAGWAQPFAFVMGIALVQLIVVVRALGRSMTSRSIAEIYVDNAKR